MDDKLISETYLTEIALNSQFVVENYYIAFWMAESYNDTVEYYLADNIENAVDLICLDNVDKKEVVKAKLEDKNISLFYAIDKKEDSEDLTLLVVSKDPNRVKLSSMALNRMYEGDKDTFFKILKIEGLRVR